MKILVFLHGTSIMHRTAVGRSREERVKQVKAKDPSVYDYATYVPVDGVVNKLKIWQKQGAEIVYLSSHKIRKSIEKDKLVLEKYHFPKGEVYYRKRGEDYKDVAERIIPDVLIEDDCESIGGEKEMTYTYIDPEIKRKIKLIIVKEFEGIDHLSESLQKLVDQESHKNLSRNV